MDIFGDEFQALASEWLVRALYAIAIFYVGKIVARWLSGRVANFLGSQGLNELLMKLAQNTTYIALMLLVSLAALEQIGIDTTSALAVFGAAGVAVGLAIKDSLSNFASGVLIAFFEPFKIGQWVDAGGSSGTVVEVGMFNTVLLSLDNKRVIIPNSVVYTGTIVNYSAEENRMVEMTFGIGYDDDIRKAKEIMQSLLNADERILDEPAPVVALAELADSSVNFNVRPWVKQADYWDVKADITEKVKLAFDDSGISIPYPQMDVHVNGNGDSAG